MRFLTKCNTIVEALTGLAAIIGIAFRSTPLETIHNHLLLLRENSMSYVKENLMPNEKVLFSARIHPAIFLPSIFTFALTLVICIYAFNLAGRQGMISSTPSGSSSLSGMVLCFSGILFLYSLMLLLEEIIIKLTTIFRLPIGV